MFLVSGIFPLDFRDDAWVSASPESGSDILRPKRGPRCTEFHGLLHHEGTPQEDLQGGGGGGRREE